MQPLTSLRVSPALPLLGLGLALCGAVVYLGFLIYLFLGVAIVADLFMASIEVITSKTKTLTVRNIKTPRRLCVTQQLRG